MSKPRVFTCTSSLFPAMDDIDAARFSAREGFTGMEIQCNPLGLWPTKVAPSMVDELIAIGNGEGIEYSLYPSDILNPATDLPEERGAQRGVFKRSVDLAMRLRSPVLILHPGVATELFNFERKGMPFKVNRFDHERLLTDARSRAIETITEWAEYVTQMPLILPIENEVHLCNTVAPTADILLKMVEATGRDNVKVNMDTGHAFIGSGLAEEFKVLRDRIVHFHLNDGRVKGISEHLPLGEGEIDLKPLTPFMKSFEGAMVLEIFAPERPLEATLQSRDFILDVMAQ